MSLQFYSCHHFKLSPLFRLGIHIQCRSNSSKSKRGFGKGPQKRKMEISGNSSFDTQPRIHILGLGNIGKYVAHSLRRWNPDLGITLLLYKQELFDRFEKEGGGIMLISQEEDGEKETNFQGGYKLASSTEYTGPRIHNLIVACKGNSTVGALRCVAPFLHGNSNVLFLQNGLPNTNDVNRKYFRDREDWYIPKYYAGVVTAGVYNNTGRAFSIVRGGRGTVKIGPMFRGELPGIEDNVLLKALSKCVDINPVILNTRNEIFVEQIRKLAVNAVINPLTAIFGCKNGVLFGSELRVKVIRDLIMTEIGPIVRAILPPGTDERVMKEFEDEELFETIRSIAQRTGANTSSMLGDCKVKGGRGCEIMGILGALRDYAQLKNVGIETKKIDNLISWVLGLRPEFYREEGKCKTITGKLVCQQVWRDIDWSKDTW